MASQGDPRAEIWQQGDVWVSVGRRVSSLTVTKVRASTEYLYFEKAGLRTDSQQVPMAAITDVDSSQSMTQKMAQVGSVRVFVVRPDGARETVLLEDLPDFKDAVTQINNLSRAARQAAIVARQTQHITYGGQIPTQQTTATHAPTPVPAAPSADDIFAQIERLASLKDKGIVTEAEYEAKKSDLLSRL